MIRIYPIETHDQLAVIGPELRATLPSMQAEFDRSEQHAWDDLIAYPDQHPYAAIWVALEDGRLVAWSGAKIYVDLPRTITAAATWAWAAPGAGEAPGMLHRVMQEWARERGASALYAARRTRLPAYARWVARYGYQFDRVVFVHRLSDAGASADEGASNELVGRAAASAHDAPAPSRPDRATRPRVRREGVAVPVAGRGHEPLGDPGAEADVRSDAARADRTDGASAGNGDLGAAPASRVPDAKRKVRRANRHGAKARGRPKHGRGVRSGIVPP